MSYFFTDNFRKALFANPAIMTGASFRIRLFRTAPAMTSPSASQWLTASTMAELVNYIGWEEVSGIPGYPGSMHVQSSLTVREDGVNNYVILDQYPFDPDIPNVTRVEGLAIEFVGTLNGIANGLIFVTNTPVGSFMNLDPGDILTANEDRTLGLAVNRWLLAWADSPTPPVGDPPLDWTSMKPIEGPLAFLRSPPLFEASNTLHVWCYPQRANMIANPSFEYDASQWAPMPSRVREAPFLPVLAGSVPTSAALLTLTPVVGQFWTVTADNSIWEYQGPDPNDDITKWVEYIEALNKGWCGQFVRAGAAPMAIESNVWETRLGYNDEETWTLQLMAKGSGKLKLALVSWDLDYRATNVDWGTETWDLSADAWIHAACVRYGPQAHTAMMRIEVASGGTSQQVKLDRVLAERGALKEYPYFDGDEGFGARDDYSWYGGSSRRGVSYSMWYGGRRSVVGRMFATPTNTDVPGDILTDLDVKNAGMVYDWVPAGVTVIPHMDVFYPTDLKGPLAPRRPTVLPPAGPDDPLGVDTPWTPESLPSGLWLSGAADIGVSAVSGVFVHGTRPTVTINKGASQADPSTTATTVVFDVVFSEAVTGFTSADVILGGTAGPTTAVVAGSGAVYTVTVSGMVTDGSVTASIVDSAALSATSDRTQSSTSTDNSVAWFDPLKQTGWWGSAYNGPMTYTKQVGGTGLTKIAGAAAYSGNSGPGGACVVNMPVGIYVVSIGESAAGTPSAIVAQQETWGFGGWGGRTDSGTWTGLHGGGRTELRTSAARSSAVLIAPGGGTIGAGGFPAGLPATSTGGGYSGFTGTGGTATAPGTGGLGYGSPPPGTGTSGASGDTGSGQGAGGRGGVGVYDFGPGGPGGAGGAGYHGGGGGAGGDGSSVGGQGGGGGSGYTGGASAVLSTYTGVCGGMGLAAMQVRQTYSDAVRQFLLGSSPRIYVPGEEGFETGCIVVSDIMTGKPFFDREAATIFDGTLAAPVQMFQGQMINGRGAMHVSRVSGQRNPDFQMTAVDAASGFSFWNPPAFNAGNSWAIEWTQQAIAGNADGPGAASVTTAGNYGNATSGQIPWKVSADATSISLTVATTAMATVASASATFPSHATTIITRYGISYNAANDTFFFYRSDGQTNSKTRTAAGLPTSGQWNAATYRPLMFSSLTTSAESLIQDVAVFDTHRSQAQFNAGCVALGTFVQTFAYTGGAQTFIVPPGVTTITSELDGAQGGNVTSGIPALGGRGGHLVSTHTVTPGESIQINVGQQPVDSSGGVAGTTGGFNGGGTSSGASSSSGRGGGGATDIRRGGTALANRLAVAGGGGGAGAGFPNSHPNAIGGDGAGNGNGVNGQNSETGLAGGGGATPSAGGTPGGSGGAWSGVPTAGALGVGGTSGQYHGGGGGGGLYGGGGGPGDLGPGGGGGGSGGVTSGAVVSAATGTRTGHGQAIIRWTL